MLVWTLFERRDPHMEGVIFVWARLYEGWTLIWTGCIVDGFVLCGRDA